MKFQKGVSHFKSLVFLVSCYDRAKFHHHFLQLSREFQHPRSSRAEETREESREKITVILGGWEKEGPSILRPSPDFWQHDRFASYSRRRFRRVTGIGDHVAGITFLRPTLFSNRGERARSALFATFSPIPEFLPRHRLSISYPSRKNNIFWNEIDENLLRDHREIYNEKERRILFKIVSKFSKAKMERDRSRKRQMKARVKLLLNVQFVQACLEYIH